MNVNDALLLADGAYTGFSGHLEALRTLAAEVRRQQSEIHEFRETIIQTIAHIQVARSLMKDADPNRTPQNLLAEVNRNDPS